MLTYHLKPHDQQPLYEQLYHAVRADIMSGALPGGTRLPSKRQLAANLRVSQITVETAYGQLAAEGYIASAPRRGYFVQEQLAVPVSEPQEPFAPPLPPISASEGDLSTIFARILSITAAFRSPHGRGCRAVC